ncbi:MAG: hypothetical protein M3R39_09260, partial [Actinomycetota bacterium]|nr:hypothetical protein [Actinomycetota bacterium]
PVPPGAALVAFDAGKAGPVAVLLGPDERSLVLVQARRRTQLAAGLPPGVTLGWPGLALDARGLPVIAYTRWRRSTHETVLVLACVDRRGRVSLQNVTSEGFPKSYVAPPAAPLFVGGRVHVIESYGLDGAVGTIEWRPRRHAWAGQYIDAGIGDYPVGPLLAATGAGGTVYAAWTQALLGTGDLPVTLAVHGRSIQSDFVLDRAVTSGLAVPAAGPEVAADEWVTADEMGLPGSAVTWAGTLVGHGRKVELDGWIADVGAAPRGARDLLLAGPNGLSWFRSPRPPQIRVSLEAAATGTGALIVSGRIRGAAGGTVTVYRERPGSPRESAGSARLSADGSFSFVDRPQVRPLLYRAVYVDMATGIPYAALLREPVL